MRLDIQIVLLAAFGFFGSGAIRSSLIQPLSEIMHGQSYRRNDDF